jgi:hypothetical protein
MSGPPDGPAASFVSLKLASRGGSPSLTSFVPTHHADGTPCADKDWIQVIEQMAEALDEAESKSRLA